MPDPAKILLRVRVQPRGSRNEIQGVVDGQLRIKTTASPVDGKATKEVTRQLAKAFGVAPSQVTLKKGNRSRNKVFCIERPGTIPDFLVGIQDKGRS